MALPKLTSDLAIISKMGDYPGSDNNLEPDQFRAQFDIAPLLIQAYINDELVPNLDMLVDVQALINGILDSTLTQENKAAPAKLVGDELAKLLPISGGTMTGTLDMGGESLTNLSAPVNDSDAVSKGYVDDKHAFFTVSVPAASWSGAGPYSQVVGATGILSTDRPHYDVVLSNNKATAISELEAFGLVSKLETANNTVTLTCLEEKPATDLTIQMEVNR